MCQISEDLRILAFFQILKILHLNTLKGHAKCLDLLAGGWVCLGGPTWLPPSFQAELGAGRAWVSCPYLVAAPLAASLARETNGQVAHLPNVPSPNWQGPQLPNCHFPLYALDLWKFRDIKRISTRHTLLYCSTSMPRLFILKESVSRFFFTFGLPVQRPDMFPYL
jgi:hypothetical protein